MCERVSALVLQNVFCFLKKNVFSPFHLIHRFIQIGGHSAGGHLAICMYNYLVQSHNPHRSIVKSLHLICGVYDVSELRFTDTANANNILKVTDDNCKKLSPIYLNYTIWASDGVRIHVYAAELDCSKLLEHSQRLHEILLQYKCNSRFRMMDGLDHFDIVEKLAEPNYEINTEIMKELKSVHFDE